MVLTKRFKGVSLKSIGQAAKGLAMSKMRGAKARGAITRNLTNKIGPEGVVGAKNYNAHYKTVKKLVKKGDVPGAVKYSRSQAKKVHASASR